MSNLSKLKKTLISFETFPLEKCRVVWRSAESPLKDEEILSDYCWTTSKKTGGGAKKIFWADLYGGINISDNGGSGRSGYDGKYQVKGIGKTPLIGRGLDFYHSNGILEICEAVSEAFWGDILKDILPHGAVPSIAIIETSTHVSEESSELDIHQTLLVRDAPVRLAHFDRALLFRPSAEFSHSLPRDCERVEQNILQIENFMGVIGEEVLAIESEVGKGRVLISFIIKRLARQLAFCRASMLKLTTSPSNVTITGKLLDFNVTSHAAPKAFRCRDSYDEQVKHINHEWLDLLPTIQNINFLWCKYRGGEHPPMSSQEIDCLYKKTHEDWRAFYIFCRLGFPPEAYKKIGTKKIKSLVTHYERAVKKTPELIFSTEGRSPHITRLLIELKVSKSLARVKLKKVVRHGVGYSLLNTFLDIFLDVQEVFPSPFLINAMILSSSRQLSIPSILDYRELKYGLIDSVLTISDYINDGANKARFVLSLSREGAVDVMPSYCDGLNYDWLTGRWDLSGKVIPPEDFPFKLASVLKTLYPVDVINQFFTEEGRLYV